MLTFGKIIVLIDYLFIYPDHIELKDKLSYQKKIILVLMKSIFIFCSKYIFYILFSFIIVCSLNYPSFLNLYVI